MLPESETIQFEDRTYVNPEVSLQEQNAFIDNLRNVQNQNNAEIATDTYNLGTAIPSNLGGLGGGESYFTSRYQVPQGVALANNLRATAQAQALNDILSNEQAMMKQRYNNAQRAARQRALARANNPTGTTEGGVDYEDTESGDRTVARVEPSYSPMGSGDFQYTSNGDRLNKGGVLSPNQGAVIPGPGNKLNASGNVNIQRNKYGDITSLTYNGQTFNGAAAQQRYKWLQSAGSIGGGK